jgi:hypothetical protein
MEKQGSLLVLRDGKYERKRLKLFRVHDELGISHDFANGFRGEVIIEEASGGEVDLHLLHARIEEVAKSKNERMVGAKLWVAALLIIFGMAARQMMLLHWLH